MNAKYDHKLVEEGKNKKWIEKKFFSIHDVNKKPFSIIMPPPNVTGKLHLGHAWDGFLQDTIIRYKKLQGFDVCFVPGMDHAGIATQAKVEQRLLSQGINKHDIGRAEFIKKALEWKDEYSNLIHQQWAKLGLALDYNLERFTLDKDSNDAVNKVFIDMYNAGLIYRDVQPINWDPKLKTAISNIEVISKPTKSKMYYVKYFFENSKDFVVVATTRIETIFSDVAIAINPNDEKNKKYLNKKVINPLNQKLLPIIADDYIDINFGTGFMKVSAHAINDIQIIKKNNLEIIECIDINGIMNKNALFAEGKTREEARKLIYDQLVKTGNIDFIKDVENNVSYSERSNEVIEILVMPQWFVKMKELSKKLLDNLKTKNKVNIHPIRFEGVLKKWMENVNDWTISRQLWWGHQIPAWYKEDKILVQIESPGEGWKRDEDVLDTWFSSALCPFSFLGWPNDDFKLKRYFPTSLLVTGYDIIFFWVARMYFQSLEFMKQIPFQDLLIHGLIRDEKGRKMSKSLGNGIDPMDVIDQYGSDALRWFLLTNSTPGQDINFSREKIEAAWNLNNKLWNISRFIKLMEDDAQNNYSDADKWITNQLNQLNELINDKMSKYEFTIIGKKIFDFINNDFSSWYIEFLKVWPNKKHALNILKNLLILIHPFLPFISDHIFVDIFNEELLDNKFDLPNQAQEEKINFIIDVIKIIRDSRNKFDLTNKDIIQYEIKNIDELTQNQITSIVDKLANAKFFKNDGALFTRNDVVVTIHLDEKLKNQEKDKLQKEIKKLENEVNRSHNILSNQNFIIKASKAKIEEEEEKFQNYKKQLNVLKQKLKELD